MMTRTILFLILLTCQSLVGGQNINNKSKDQSKASQELAKYNTEKRRILNIKQLAKWTYNTNETDYNKNQMIKAELKEAKYSQDAAQKMSGFDTTNFPDSLKRQIKKILDIGVAAQKNPTKLQRFKELKTTMTAFYNNATVCLSKSECLPLFPELENLFLESRNYNRLLKAWTGLSDVTGKKIRQFYPEYVKLSNEAIKILGFPDTGAYWRSVYELDNFEEELERLYKQISPLYKHLHAFVRRKLKAIYGAKKFPTSGHIPAHLLGDVWAQQFVLGQDGVPFPNADKVNVDEELKKQNYDSTKIFKTAEDFFVSLGLPKLPNEFWANSMLEKPKDGRNVSCQPQTFNLFNGNDFRTLQCTQSNVDHFRMAHFAVGAVQYMRQFQNQPIEFRHAANPGFRAAIGDTITLSSLTPGHMKTIGLLSQFQNNNQTDINSLMRMAMTTVAFLPYGYIVDLWRGRVFSGKTTPENYNKHWWTLRRKYQGISPPVSRSESDFDIGKLYHISSNEPYIRYFLSVIYQFQFHKALCHAAGHTGDLHRCDVYNSKAAGDILKKMFQLGSSKPWPEAMKVVTGNKKMDAQPLLDYFKPLLEYLKAENGKDFGWTENCRKPRTA